MRREIGAFPDETPAPVDRCSAPTSEQEADMAVDTLTRDIARRLTRGGFTGELIEPQSGASYEEARRVWSGSIDRRPAAIARCQDAEDVAAAVTATVDLGLPLAVRGG